MWSVANMLANLIRLLRGVDVEERKGIWYEIVDMMNAVETNLPHSWVKTC